jgi:hypothetical protein
VALLPDQDHWGDPFGFGAPGRQQKTMMPKRNFRVSDVLWLGKDRPARRR